MLGRFYAVSDSYGGKRIAITLYRCSVRTAHAPFPEQYKWT